MILLVLAFFIYGIFSPSWAARLWYNVRTFPQRMASWMSPDLEFLDYDNYKIGISSIGDKIWDKIGLWDEEFDVNLWNKNDVEIGEKSGEESEIYVEKNIEKGDDSQLIEKQTIKSFPKSMKFFQLLKLKENNKKWNLLEDKTGDILELSWCSKADLIWVINKYIEKNLDDDTDILVTVEYEDDSVDPQKIVLQTQKKSSSDVYNTVSSESLLDDLFE